MWLCKYGTARKDICKTKLKQRFHSYCFFKASLWKVCEACPELFIRLNFPMISHCFIQNPAFESSEEKYYPHNFSAKRPRIGTIVKNHIQSSSCLFRTTLFVCSESDTSLMNYNIIQLKLEQVSLLQSSQTHECAPQPHHILNSKIIKT